MPISTCNITGTLTDSAGNPVGGSLAVTLDTQSIVDDTTTPPTIILNIPGSPFTIDTDGVVDISIPITETTPTTMTFTFTPTSGDVWSFHAEVPDVPTAYLSSLIPTGYTTDRLATGALRIGREITTNPLLLPYVVQALGIYRSDTEPTGQSDMDYWLPSDTGLVWAWDASLSKWKSTLREKTVDVFGATSTQTVLAAVDAVSTYSTIMLQYAQIRYNITAGPNDSSNHWTVQAGYKTGSSSSLTSISTSFDTTGLATGTIFVNRYTPSPATQLNTNVVEAWGVDLTATGSPGPINASVTYAYRYLYS
jgi:hypothetical protein